VTRRGIAAALGLCLAVASANAWGASEEQPAPEAGQRNALRIGIPPVESLDPHFTASAADIQVLEQIYEHLTGIDAGNRPVPELATRWESSDGRTWTFFLREQARFSDGRPVTATDVAWTFDRLRDPVVGSPVLPLYRGIVEVRALDRQRVRFVLAEPDGEFPLDVGDYHAAIVPAGAVTPGQKIGSGPFALAFHFPGSRIILRRNPYYDERAPSGQRLPRFEELHFIFSSSAELLVGALERGEIAYVGGLTADAVRRLRSSRRVRIETVDANMHWLIHMRVDAGRPAADNRVRQALKLATSHQALIDGTRPRLASAGNGFTPIGPAFGRYYLVRPPFTDRRRARDLLAEAGYPRGLRILLTVPDQTEAVRIASLWRKQVGWIGVVVDLDVVPVEVYYGTGPRSWLEADFGVTDWGARPKPLAYLKLAYTGGAPWSESRWSDPELDEIVARIQRELDETARTRLYHRAQEILIDRGPVIVAYFAKAAAGIAADLQGVTLASDWPRTSFRDAYYAR
jgi:peptide/nickel transport system substrate-binding protein